MAVGLLTHTGFRIERRPASGRLVWVQIFALAFVASVIACALLFRVAGAEVWASFEALYVGGFGSFRAITNTLVRATPLILTGLAAALAFRARIWNIGAEGQLFAGAMFAYWVTHGLVGVPAPVVVALALIGGFVGGALYGGLAGVLKTGFGVDEVISTVMLNYIILYVLSLLLLNGPWSDSGSFYQQTAKLPESFGLAVLIEGTRLHAGFLVALAAALLVYLLIGRTSLGYEIRGIGFNPRALRMKGTNTAWLFVTVMAVSGGIAGLAGVGEVFGVHHRLLASISPGFGYTGIIIAILGRLNPLGVVAAAILFGGLVNAATYMQIRTGVPSALTYAIQAIILLFFLAAAALGRYRIRRVRDNV